jgi:Ser-tRNA(Ala) deacylase AlaX
VIRRGKIFHYLRGDIPQSSLIHGKIDWEPRFYNMRRHSAEHLLTGLFETIGSGPKVYSDLERLDFKPSKLDIDAVSQVKVRFNEIVDRNVPVRSYYVDRSELNLSEDERKLSFLKKIPKEIDKLRMIDISGYALTFCFGTHVRSTREIGKLSELRLKLGKKGRKIIQFFLE